nr:lysozyme [uncultured Mediterranean phage uvMED]
MSWEILLAVLIMMESSGDSLAIGDDGRSVGILQIGTMVVDDVNRVYQTKYTYEDRYKANVSKDLCRWYLSWYGRAKRIGEEKHNTYEAYARIWNGGPDGWKKESTQKYWDKFQRVANEMGFVL